MDSVSQKYTLLTISLLFIVLVIHLLVRERVIFHFTKNGFQAERVHTSHALPAVLFSIPSADGHYLRTLCPGHLGTSG